MIKMTEERDAPPIRPLAFISALALAPATIALPCLALALLVGPGDFANVEASFLFFVPFVAMFLGAPTYLTFGAYALHSALRRRHSTAWQFARQGLRAHLTSMPLAIIIFTLADPNTAVQFTAGFFLLGLIFAPLWSAIFANLYRRMS